MKLDELDNLKKQALKEILASKDGKSLENLRVKFLGRKGGELTKILRTLKDLPIVEKRKIGPAANALREELEQAFKQKLKELLTSNPQLPTNLDITMPGKKIAVGHLHPLTLVENEIREIFKALNFSVVEGPEAETEHYNFDALNIPKDHPARDMWDTFWLKQETRDKKQETSKKNNTPHVADRLLLRTHTSPVQVRYMETHQPPFQIIVPGRVFRYEATDASHEINFYQVEGLMVGKDITLANFKYVIQEFFSRLFKKTVAIRLRPSYFPFVEPGLEVDVQCVKCGGKGCNVCKESGWLEVMGAGMVHPNVFEAAHYNPRDLQGFAFGLGLERIAMIKYNIPDIRLFYSGDLRFIKQF
ncbi:MAG: phenylalanine--tRNA ligase subunit alpha [Candidatus Harrisonbacteria bacterium RIFCSPLOWO2_02_FULL_41_11]|uniref:Phenylalanine--tRNA ligase alpha subunit n=1 Tax=Candidatus Harrisonbacteria bacterium RIFCSPHIGHO2_02_FULL_42_16 TaxID=1798404 RepID=A0A1G1ZHN0_9BACT|nr:MAG: phenylalanine--tRNA ligase subunit alpha [Candidatus Harrisonbacteria bacterium RIFCSPHIGHO2_02_FULL_42_16]OGY66180.1 MAG: phenylalanine--tRNA ligase subunit alpha [Candidatus Harrisonbacteria bacterium RIFCSPLOWO2_02_FULL_41_11]